MMRQWRTFVLTGDGELQEGSNWEAAMAAAHFGLDNLTWIVDRNGLQQGDATERTIRLEPLADKMRAFGWAVREVDGHDHAALLEAFRALPFEAGKPNGIIAHTHKGKGVSLIQDRAEWHHHHRALSDDEMAAALAELGVGIRDQESGISLEAGSWNLASRSRSQCNPFQRVWEMSASEFIRRRHRRARSAIAATRSLPRSRRWPAPTGASSPCATIRSAPASSDASPRNSRIVWSTSASPSRT